MKDRPKGRPGARQVQVREKELERDHERREQKRKKASTIEGVEVNAQRTLTALNAALDLNLSGALSEEGIVDVSGTFVATLVSEGTADGAIYRALEMLPVAGGAGVASVTAPGAWRVNFAGCKAARIRVSAYTSGSAVVAAQVMKKAA